MEYADTLYHIMKKQKEENEKKNEKEQTNPNGSPLSNRFKNTVSLRYIGIRTQA
jgi:hypothetical protein